eukprot:302787_1
MLVVETNEGVEEFKGEEKYDRQIVIADKQMGAFIEENNLYDIQEHLINSKFTIQHLQSMNDGKNADAQIDDICDKEWKVSPSQKFRFKYAVASLGTVKHQSLKKILIIGDSGVGKTCIFNVLDDEHWHKHNGLSTIGVDFHINNQSKNKNVSIKFQVWDTAGQERFRNITGTYYRGAAAVFVVYDITDKYSFDNVALWLKEIENQCRVGKVLLIGSKLDLQNEHRAVSVYEAKQFALIHGLPLLEVSAKTNQNMNVLKTWISHSMDIQLVEKIGVVNLNQASVVVQEKKKTNTCCG